MTSQPQTTADRDIVAIDDLRETDGSRLTEIDPDHVENLEESIELEGLIEPIVVTSSPSSEYAYDIVDGRHRKRALERIGVEEVAVYAMPGERDYVVPTREAEVDVDIQSMAANVLRKEHTQAEEARFLQNNIDEKIISELTDVERDKLDTDSDSNYADARVTPLQLIDHLENVKSGGVAWKFSDEHYQELRRLLSAADCAPKTASEHIRFYTNSPDDVVEAWKQDDITKGFVKQIRQITQDNLRAHALEKSKSDDDDGYSTRDVETVKRIANTDAPKAHEKLVCGEISDLDDAVEQAKEEEEHEDDPGDEPGDVDEDEFEKFKRETLTEEDRKKAEQIATHEDELSVEDVFKECYRMYEDGDGFRAALITAVEQIEALEREMVERRKQRRQALDNFDFTTGSEFAAGEANHLAPPVETENFGVFFHDVQEMDDEVGDEELQLIFTSPPYFTQSDRIVERWWPGDVEHTSDNVTERNVDKAYQNYLGEMEEVFHLLHSKLEEGRYLILNISDIKAYDVGSKVYDVPADLSYLIRHKVNDHYELANQFKYDATIAWDKGKKQAHDRNQSFFAEGKPLTYHPNWRSERLLVFRKGKRVHPETEFRLDPNEFQSFSDDLWSIENDTDASDHEAGFTVDLPLKILQLYSLPGDTIADVFGGYSTTLRAAKILNEQEYPDKPDWTGYAWENFASESADQQDYRERIEQLLTSSLTQFRGSYLRSRRSS